MTLPPIAEQVKQDGYITIAGTLYHCNGYTGNAPYLYLRYDSVSKQVVLQTGWSNDRNTVLVLEQTDIPIWKQNSWSPDCRYISAALGDKHHTDTVVWDVVMRRRVAVFPDAHEIPHPFVWSPYSGLALIQTRSGGYLWNVATDTKMLLHDGVITRSGYSPQVTNFYEFKWDEKRGQLLAVGVNTRDRVTAYDAHMGQQIAFYSVPQPTGIVSFYLSPDGSKINVYSGRYYYDYSLSIFSKQESNQVIWDRDRGTPLLHFKPPHPYIQFSPDGHYLAEKTKGGLLVWDLTHPNGDSSPSYRLTLSNDGTYNAYFFSFVDNTTFEVTVDPTADNPHKLVTRWDIVSGAFLGKVIPAAPASNWSAPQSTSPGVSGIAGQLGDGIPFNCQSGDERSNLLLRYETVVCCLSIGQAGSC
ncbi:MAG: WD40 repeat domain-containing protein [Anaerolineae bacterium]|nr:WD40 repeat domain-containing protein [Anaerolineae bacterium]